MHTLLFIWDVLLTLAVVGLFVSGEDEVPAVDVISQELSGEERESEPFTVDSEIPAGSLGYSVAGKAERTPWPVRKRELVEAARTRRAERERLREEM